MILSCFIKFTIEEMITYLFDDFFFELGRIGLMGRCI